MSPIDSGARTRPVKGVVVGIPGMAVERTGISVSPPAKRYMSCVVKANPIKAIRVRCRILLDHRELTAQEKQGKHQTIGMETSLR